MGEKGRKGMNEPKYGSGSSTTPCVSESVEVEVGFHGLVLVIARCFFSVRMKGMTTVISRKMSKTTEHSTASTHGPRAVGGPLDT